MLLKMYIVEHMYVLPFQLTCADMLYIIQNQSVCKTYKELLEKLIKRILCAKGIVSQHNVFNTSKSLKQLKLP